jgi:GAF domain-containing protein
MHVTRQQLITQAFVELADTLVDHYDVVDLMHTLGERCVELFDVDAAGIILRDTRQRLVAVASTSDEADLSEVFAIQNSEGPCLECVRTGERVVNVDIDDATRRWPHFVAKVAEYGYVTTHAFPLRLRAEVLGVINLFCRSRTTLSNDDIAVVQGLADIATIGLLQQRAVSQHEILSEQLHVALNSRIVIEQAKGALAERARINVAEAFEVMRTYSRREGRLLRDTAVAVIADELDIDQLRGHRPQT